MTVNLAVVRRLAPCRYYASPERMSDCRSCRLLHHVRGQGDSPTFCGHACTSMDGWVELEDAHPEDVSAVDRCLVCYRGIEARKREDRASGRHLIALPSPEVEARAA